MELTIEVTSQGEAMVLFGLEDRNLKLIRDALPVNITARNGLLRLSGEKERVEEAAEVLNGLLARIRSGLEVPTDYVRRQLDGLRSSPLLAGKQNGEAVRTSAIRVQTEPVERLSRSPGQEAYLRAILENDLVFCIGPAGTGKTFLAVRMAINYLRAGDIRKIVLCRPAVEAGERLGFLPGDFQAKINPYLRPLYDALNDILDYDQVKRFIEREIIEVVPLAFMRGRTLNHSFIILDEAQNTTTHQMKMFLTRMGETTKIVVNGDITQIDLPEGMVSGLIQAREVMRSVPGIRWVEMQREDIVRHALVKRIVEAYEIFEKGPPGAGEGRRG
jgi:phosphate starvation-inducible PhoH-like protein